MKSDFTCGFGDESVLCYELSKEKNEICSRIFDENGNSLFRHFRKKYNLKIEFEMVILQLVMFSVIICVGANFIHQNYANQVSPKKNKARNEILRNEI